MALLWSAWHQSNRVLCQFKMQQHILAPPLHQENLHGVTPKGKNTKDWAHVH